MKSDRRRRNVRHSGVSSVLHSFVCNVYIVYTIYIIYTRNREHTKHTKTEVNKDDDSRKNNKGKRFFAY